MKCLACGKEFEVVRATAKFCSVSCKHAYHRGLSVPPVSVPKILSVPDEGIFSVPEGVSVPVESDDDVGTPAKVIDLVKNLHLNMARDLGVRAWTADGIFILPEITVSQVQNIARLIHAKHGRPCPEFRQQGV